MGFKRLREHRTKIDINKDNLKLWYGEIFPKISEIIKMTDGKTNDVVLIKYENGKTAYLKFFNDCFENRAEKEIYFREKFSNLVPIPRIIYEDFSHEYQPRSLICFEPSKGSQMSKEITTNQLEELINTLKKFSKFENEAHGLITPNGIDNLQLNDHKEFLSDVVNESIKRSPELIEFQKKYFKIFDGINLEKPSLTHQSFNHKHIFFEKDSLSGLIDWESAAFIDKHVDLASLYVSLIELSASHKIISKLVDYVKKEQSYDNFCLFVSRQFILDAGFKHGFAEVDYLKYIDRSLRNKL